MSFGRTPEIECAGKYPRFYTQERSTFDSRDPVDLIQKKEGKSKSKSEMRKY